MKSIKVSLLSFSSPPKRVTLIPFYGGAKGQSLQITEHQDGKVTTAVVKTPPDEEPTHQPEPEANPTISDVEYPPLPVKYDFADDIRQIQTTAMEIIKLQEKAKDKGGLSVKDEEDYNGNMEILNRSAQSLAKIQDESFESREGLSEWFDRKATSSKDKKKKEEDKKYKEEEKRKKEEAEKLKKEEEERKRKEEEEKKKQEENENKQGEEQGEEEEEEIDTSDTVEINLPPEDASVAEAKPIGLAVAGAGGVAASKPIATAVVGPGGLAIARPVGTAIAGVSPDQAMLPVYLETYHKRIPGQNKDPDHFIGNLINKYHQK